MVEVKLDEYWMEIARELATHTTCLRRQVGAVISKDDKLISKGYNCVPKGTQTCSSKGCIRKEKNVPSGERQELCRAVHAEPNAIIEAAKQGISIEGATLWVSVTPCHICANLIVASGIKEVVFDDFYPDEMSIELFKEAGVKLRRIETKK